LSTAEDSDEVLVARAGRGDRLAASTLVLRHSSRILALCGRMLRDRAAAEDAAQETFMRLWRHADRWRPNGARFDTWLYRVAANVCLDRLRRRGRETTLDEPPDAPDDAPLAIDIMLAEERRRAVESALAGLPERQRLAIALCHYQELSNIEAARVMEISVDALESLLARGRRSLKERLAPYQAELMEGAI
jgi:RNA polymerase sigma-70 factor (ECF subfamily)